MSDTIIEGGCYCGAVEYQVTGTPGKSSICCCESCRRVTGAPGLAYLSVSQDQFRVTKGKPAELHAPPATRLFCARCGTHLAYMNSYVKGEVCVTTCSLRDPKPFAPPEFVAGEGKIPWVPETGNVC